MPDAMSIRRFAARLTIGSASLLAVACIPAPQPAPPVVVAPTPTPTPAPPPPMISEPTYANFLDAPQTPGDWSHALAAGTSRADFAASGGQAEFRISCNLSSRRITLARIGTAGRDAPMRIRTETVERLVSASPDGSGRWLVTELAPRDPLLDAIAFSRGRFAVETAGLRTLYLPSWPEITRVIEDCR